MPKMQEFLGTACPRAGFAGMKPYKLLTLGKYPFTGEGALCPKTAILLKNRNFKLKTPINLHPRLNNLFCVGEEES